MNDAIGKSSSSDPMDTNISPIDLDILWSDWAFHCCPSFVGCLGYEEDRKIIVELARKITNPNFFSTDLNMTMHSTFMGELGIMVTPVVCKQIRDGWLRIAKLQQKMVNWVD
jgi:hypothetical protein